MTVNVGGKRRGRGAEAVADEEKKEEKSKVNKHVLEEFSENEEDRIKDITDNIVKLVPTLINKEIDLFSSKVNQNLNGI